MNKTKISSKHIFKRSLLLLALLLISWFSFRHIYSLILPVNPFDRTLIEVNIPENSSSNQIADILLEHNLIKSKDAFRLYCRLLNYDSRLLAGTYQFRRSQSTPEIVKDMVEGRVATLTLTIPEGYNLNQIGEAVVKKGFCTEEEWKAALTYPYDYPVIKELPMKENRLEGFLFPDTYRIRKEATPKQIIELMLKRFFEVWDKQFADLAKKQGISVYRAVTIASLIEEEAMYDDERARIAGVLYNRLKIDMPLQVDATILYSLGEHRTTVYLNDLTVDSPYNTYSRAGLPPGPIASPGAASLAAALSPEKHEYYYYVAMKDGHHHFSKTYEEHLQAKNKNRR